MEKFYRVEKSQICTHRFYDLKNITDYESTGHIWFYCEFCLMLIKRKLVDESEKL